MTEIQSLIFEKNKYNRAQAIDWARESGFKFERITEDETRLYFEQRIEQDFTEGSLQEIAVLEGIKQKVGELKTEAPETPREVRTITNVEIFSEGVWNGNVISMGDLDEIVRAYELTHNTVRPYLKLGHDDNQAILQSDGLPAAGWIDNLRRVGNKIVADFVDVPKKIFELIDLKAYRKVSSEIYHNIEINGQTFSKMLGAVALLGANTPGVMNLNDILSMYKYKYKTFNNDAEKSIINFMEDSMPKSALEERLEKEVNDLKEKLSAADAEKANYSKKDKELEDIKAELKEKADKIEEFKKVEEANKLKAEEAERVAFAAELEKDELSTPAMKENIIALVGPERDEYSIGDKKGDKKELLKETLKLFKASLEVNLDEDSSSGKDVDNSREAEINKYMADNKCSYRQAFTAVESKHRKLED